MATVQRARAYEPNALPYSVVQRLRVVADRIPDPGQMPVTRDAAGKAVPRDVRAAVARIWKFLDTKYADFP